MNTLTQRDSNQIERYEHDEANEAKRVYIVGGADVKANFDTSQIASSIASAVKESLSESSPSIELKETVKLEIVEVEKPVVIKEPQIVEIEKQVVVTQKEIVYIDKPVVVEKIIYKEIEKPIIVKEIIDFQKKESNSLVIGCMILQTLAILGLVILKIKG